MPGMRDLAAGLGRFRVVGEGLDHPEGVATGPDGSLYAGGEAGQLYRIEGSAARQIATTGGFLLGLCLDARGAVYACDYAHRCVARIRGTEVTTYADGSGDRRMVAPNFPVFDEHGSLWVSDSGTWGRADGCLWVVHPDGRCALAVDGLAGYPNGLALDPRDGRLHVALSHAARVVAIRLDRPREPPEPVCSLPGTVPDGLAFDRDGGLLITCYATDRVFRRAPDGALGVVLADTQRQTMSAPTNVAFTGARLETMVVAGLGQWHLVAGPAPVPGAPLHFPAL
jgi:gluconolactonase